MHSYFSKLQGCGALGHAACGNKKDPKMQSSFTAAD